MHRNSGRGMLPTERIWEESAVGQRRPAPMGLMLRFILVLSYLVAGLLAGCTRSVSKPSVVYATSRVPSITIDRVQVNQGAGVYVAGRSTLPDGACVQTELLVDKKVAEWWPRDICVEIAASRWEILAALGRQGAPERLEPDVAYEIHAWYPQNPSEISTRFPFNLNGPTQ